MLASCLTSAAVAQAIARSGREPVWTTETWMIGTEATVNRLRSILCVFSVLSAITTRGVIDVSTAGLGGIAGWHIYANPNTESADAHEIAVDAVNFLRFQF